MRGQTSNEKEVIYGFVMMLVLALVVIFTVSFIARTLSYTTISFAFQNSEVMAQNVAGAVMAAASAPQSGAYCVVLPGNFEYRINLNSISYDGKDYPFLTLQIVETGLIKPVFLPLKTITPAALGSTRGQPSTFVARSVDGRVTVDLLKGALDTVNCNTVVA